MKKLLAAILVVALCSPAIADVAVTTDVSTAGEATITLTANGDTTELVGVAITVDSTAAIEDVIIDGAAVDSFFDIFVDAAFTAGAGYELGDGTAIALQDAPGETTLAANGTSFSVSIAGLDDDGIGAGTDEAPTSVTITLKCEAGATVDLGIDTLRGGVVSYAGAETVTDLPAQIVIAPNDECIAPTHPDYAEWVAVGKPASWCNPRQCHGDADNAQHIFEPSPMPPIPDRWSYVTVEDINILLEGYKDENYVDEATDPWIAADFNRQENIFEPSPMPPIPDRIARVTAEDVSILLTYYKDEAVPADCN